MEPKELDELREEMRILWEKDRLLWYCSLPYAMEKIFRNG